MGDKLEEDDIRQILEAAISDPHYPSDSEMSDMGSDDDAADEPPTGEERYDFCKFLIQEITPLIKDLDPTELEDTGLPVELDDSLHIEDCNLDKSDEVHKANIDMPNTAKTIGLLQDGTVQVDQPGPSRLCSDHSYANRPRPISVTCKTKDKKTLRPTSKKNKSQDNNANVENKPRTTNKKQTVGQNINKPKKAKPDKEPFTWKSGKDNEFTNNIPCFQGNSTVNVEGDIPIAFFEKLFPDTLLQDILNETIRYAYANNEFNFTLTIQELKAFLGVNIMMTYIKYPSSRMYWSSISALRMDFIANTISCNRFEEIKRNLHFADNAEKENLKGDKFWKIRPLLDVLHTTFHDAKSDEENQSIDEMVIPFKGRSTLKQYIKNKPKKWGFKVWVRSSATGYVSCFELYSGKQNLPTSALGPVGDMVVRVCHGIEGKNHKLFMDNFFVSLPLVRFLKTKDIYVLGTVRLDRIPKKVKDCLVEPELLKRGSMSIATSDDNVTLVRWMDTKPVHTLSTYAGSQPEDLAKRWDRSAKETIEVSRPYAVKQYNMFMGGVDLVDRMVAHYPHGFKNKKWYLRIVFHFINVTIVNAWHLYKIKTNQPKYPLLAFKASLASSLMAQAYASKKRGRPSTETPEPVKKRPAPSKMAQEVRYDGVGHYPGKIETAHPPRCHDKNCKSRTRFQCKKCKEPVCPACMEAFHTK